MEGSPLRSSVRGKRGGGSSSNGGTFRVVPSGAIHRPEPGTHSAQGRQVSWVQRPRARCRRVSHAWGSSLAECEGSRSDKEVASRP